MEQQLNNRTMVEASNKKLGPVIHEYDTVGSFSSSSVSTTSSGSSSSSLESDSCEEVTSPPSSSPSTDQLAHDPLSDMSSLIKQLPIKRGLSKHYQGKSQSFTSLANVRSLEDLAEPENPYNKKLKYSRSFGGGLSDESQTTECTPSSVVSIKHVPKRGRHPSSRGSCPSLGTRRGSANSFMGSRPPIPTQVHQHKHHP